MAREINRLSARGLPGITKVGRHADGGNLYLFITPNGGRRWTFLYRWRGKPTEIGMGSARDVSLARARELATAARAALAEGLDPRTVRNASEGSTFGDMANQLIASMENGWRNPKHRAQWRMTLLGKTPDGEDAEFDYCKPLRALDVAAITVDDVLGVLTPIWETKPETASRIRGRIERVLDFAKVKLKRSGENVARWKGHLEHTLPKPEKLSRGHHAAMPYSDVPDFMVELRDRDATAALALEFAILTAARSGEVLGAQPEEFKEGIWTVPPERMKAGKEHRVPLSHRALEIATAVGGRFELSGMAMAMLLRRMEVDCTVHGFRSSFRDWAGDETDYPREVIEAALAHTIENKAEAAYRRATALEKRRELMAAWADYCNSDSVNVR